MDGKLLSIMIILLTTIIEVYAIINSDIMNNEYAKIVVGSVVALDVLVLLGILLRI